MRCSSAVLLLAIPMLGFASCTALEAGSDTFGLPGGGANAPDMSGSGEANRGGADSANGEGGGPGGAGAAVDPVGGAATDCVPEGQRTVTRLGTSGEVTLDTDTTWGCDSDYEVAGNVLVAPGKTLRIEPGVTVRFAAKTMLLVQRGARLEAAGTLRAPITFTSAKKEGTRAPGDYRGLILIGDGPSHGSTTPVHDSLSDSRAHYGGGQAGDPNGSCGSLRYVRIDFAGGSIDDPSLPAGALTLAGCGAGTTIDHVQVHRATDGVGLLGGTAGLRHVVISNNLLGEGLEWSAGYKGVMQFIVVQSLGASAAMQGSNSVDDPETSPVSRPVIFNATLIGSAPLVTGQHFGFALQFGSRVVLKNSVIQGFADAAFDLRLAANVLKNELGAGNTVDISHTLMNANVNAYSASAQALGTMQSMRLQDPGLPAAANPTALMPDAEPLFAPSDPTVNTDPAGVPPGLDATAGFRGGVPQDGDDWTQGWTHFPNN